MVVTGQKGKWIKMRHCCDTVACGVEACTRLPLFQDLPSDFQPEQVQVLSGLAKSGSPTHLLIEVTFSSQAGTLFRSGLVNVWSGQWSGLVQVLSGLAIEQAE